jgi:hypothetical protein
MEKHNHYERLDLQIETPPLSLKALGNESGFWRKIIRGEKRLTAIQKIGILLMCFAVGGVIWSALYWENRVQPLNGTPLLVWVWERLGSWIILFVIFMLLLAFLFWRARCTLRKAQAERLLRKNQTYPGVRHY